MAFNLEPNSRYRISINTINEAEKQLNLKLYGYKIKTYNYTNDIDFITQFNELLIRCEEFATDYWSGGVKLGEAIGGYFLFFASKNDAVMFKLTVGAYFDYKHVLSLKPIRHTKPKRSSTDVPYKKPAIIRNTLKRLSTKLLLHLQDECEHNNGRHRIQGITVYLDDINYILKDRKIK